MSSLDAPPEHLPSALAHLRERSWERTTIGKSDAVVWRVTGAEETLFVKSAPWHPLSEMPGEAERLAWLERAGVYAPRLRDFAQDGAAIWLVMTALPGRDLTHLADDPAQVVPLLAQALRAIHALDPATCPFDHRLDHRLATGAANLAAGLVDEDDFDTERQGWSGQAVLDWLGQHRPLSDDLVVTHGDASLRNVVADGAGHVGVVDCGRLGVADRWQDLAIACRSLAFNGGKVRVQAFLDAYGASWDEARYRYYCTLDELF